jgi:molybdate transport system substrate-binding protein
LSNAKPIEYLAPRRIEMGFADAQPILQVMSARAVKSAVSALAQEFSRASGHTVTCEFAPVGALEQKLAAGAKPDVVILSSAAIATLAEAKQIVAGSERELGCTSIGVAVREGAAQPDIATPDAFKALLLNVRAIALSDPAVGGTAARYLPQLFARMGLGEALEAKLVRCSGGGDVAERVARGEAEIGITFVSEMLPIAGVRVVGALPALYGNDTTYCAALHTTSSAVGAAHGLIAALASPSGDQIWRSAGFVR